MNTVTAAQGMPTKEFVKYTVDELRTKKGTEGLNFTQYSWS